MSSHEGNGAWGAMRIITAVLGMLMAASGANHGIFEILQGGARTPGILINAIGPSRQMWAYGYEPAFSVLPTFRLSGLLAITASALMAIWAIFLTGRKGGKVIPFLLWAMLLLFGGGIAAQILFVLPICVYAASKDKTPAFWTKPRFARIRPVVARLWRVALPLCALLFLFALWIGITGYVPGLTDPKMILGLCYGFLLTSAILMHISYFSGMADQEIKMP